MYKQAVAYHGGYKIGLVFFKRSFVKRSFVELYSLQSFCVISIVLYLQILHADFDEEDTAYLLTVSIAKSGVTQLVKTMKKASIAKAVASKQQEKPKPKPQREPPKEKPKPKQEPKEEAYFETEEYEVCIEGVVCFFAKSNYLIPEITFRHCIFVLEIGNHL